MARDKMFIISKLTIFANDKINLTWKIEICFGKDRKHCWLPAFSLFPIRFSKDFLFQGH